MTLSKADARQDKKNTKKKLIADAALKLFMRDGYISTKIIDIAASAGIGKGTVYEYFDSKENILLYLIDDYIIPYYSRIRKEVDSCQDVTEKLRRYIRFEYEFIKQFGIYCDDIKVQLFQADAGLSQEIFKSIIRIYVIQQEVMKSIITMGIEKKIFRQMDPDLLTTVVLSFTSSSLTRWDMKKALENETITFLQMDEKVQEDILDMVINGIGYSGDE